GEARDLGLRDDAPRADDPLPAGADAAARRARPRPARRFAADGPRRARPPAAPGAARTQPLAARDRPRRSRGPELLRGAVRVHEPRLGPAPRPHKGPLQL